VNVVNTVDVKTEHASIVLKLTLFSVSVYLSQSSCHALTIAVISKDKYGVME